MLVNLHRLAKAYGKLPHEILRLTALEYSINEEAYEAGNKQDGIDQAAAIEKAQSKVRKR